MSKRYIYAQGRKRLMMMISAADLESEFPDGLIPALDKISSELLRMREWRGQPFPSAA